MPAFHPVAARRNLHQRLCIAPDADLFAALRSGRASIATDAIDRFTPTGVKLASGEELPADIVVTATGLKLQLFGGAQLTVDGVPVPVAQSLSYKGMMLAGVPNLAMAMGYTNASWTLKAELIAQYVARIVEHMDKRGLRMCVPEPGPDVGDEPVMDLQSGYVTRALASFPRQGSKVPWKLYQNYVRDLVMLRHRKLDDRGLVFRG